MEITAAARITAADINKKDGVKLGVLYDNFKDLKKQSQKDWFTDKIGVVKFELNGKNYEIFFPRKRANKYSIIHCKNNTIEWEQFPIMPRIAGRRYGIREPIISVAPTKESVRIVVILGKPNCITGLDEGNFCSVHKYNEAFINVMSEARFKEM